MIESNTRKDIEKKIDLYVAGKLSAREIDELWAELIQDEYYLDYLKTTASLQHLARENSTENTAAFTVSNIKQWSVAAAILLLVGTLAVFNIMNNDTYTVQPLEAIELDYYRSAGGNAVDSDSTDLVMESITAANQGDIERAIFMIDDELDATAGDRKIELLITAGSIHYNADDYKEAAARFENALYIETDNTVLLERAYWYLGNTYFQLNRIAEAREVLEKASELNGAYSRVAQSYIRALSE